MMQYARTKLFENVPVCVNCMRIYQFLSDVYSKLDENARNVDGKNPIFMGIDTKIND